jgi:hypothetical protein
MLDLRRGEWAAVVAMVAALVAINKVVVHDEGNTWGGLLLVSLCVGVALVHLRRFIVRRMK